ncbi:DUF4249 domain-containing protein [Flavobacteriaceae bacterium S0825]|uniref:DUF4249 domain-containing protein n=1 Tax=Gaetbulibacter sp. S0825 TaxID=2720084 RepID=UPI00143030D8|nr:DUF4249 domain-containing protein [Gaetbulibacter sp. S0825]MCK0109510.1 DUF4249 domain-containing protein [Flavobacteriaceae bacterium S0825]NIX65145.1 DUF4249 domain-containing protein [Gaetbulibacter sp. S0825]
MKLYKRHITGLILIITVLLSSCVEPFEYESENFEKLIIINTVITDEIKQQVVYITNTTPIDEHYVSPETNAQVIVKDDIGNQYVFSETEFGKYISQNPFAVIPGRNYSLNVVTSNGREYYSEEVNLVSGKKPVSVNPIRRVNDDGIVGVDILVNSFDETSSSNYYRYEYEETYKIIAPNWSPYDIVPSGFGCGSPFTLVPKQTEQRTCYNTVTSNAIIQTNTINLSEDRVGDFSVRFVPITNTIIAHRYSILVKQYVQSRNAYAYYEKINKSIQEGNVFSQLQTGFVQGNMFSKTNSNENVIGYFEVSSVVTNRVFFDFEDIFPEENKPEKECVLITPPVTEERGCGLLPFLEDSGYKYVEDNNQQGEGEGPYVITQPNCGDCTREGSAEVPIFWIE